VQLPPEKETQLQALQTDRAQLQQIIKHLEEKIAASNDDQAKATLSGVLLHAKEALAENQKQIDKLQAPGAAPRSPAAAGGQSAPATALPK
jgi:chromosome segregation ATPase